MNVARLELCRELYELSGWTKDVYWWHTSFFNTSSTVPEQRLYQVVNDDELDDYAQRSYLKEFRADPAYDLSYLLRKLPDYTHIWLNQYQAWAKHDRGPECAIADTPEDAAAKLAIELFNQGILNKEGD